MTKQSHALNDKIDAARQLEKEGNLRQAEKWYQKIIQTDAHAYEAYNRLLVIYRKLKMPRQELTIANKAIKAFETNIIEKQKQWIKENRAAARLSKSLAERLGMINKNGLPTRDDPIVTKWRKRKQLIAKRLKKN